MVTKPLTAEEIKKRRRPASEWYMMTQDRLYHQAALEKIEAIRLSQQKQNKRVAALAVTSTAVAVIALALSAISIRRNPTITKSEV